MSTRLLNRLLSGLAFLLPAVSFAHSGHSSQTLLGGLSHPLTGLDHILVAVAIGFLLIQGHRSFFRWSILFSGFVMIGAIIGSQVAFISWLEGGLVLASISLGIIILVQSELHTSEKWTKKGFIELFGFAGLAILHGLAHGQEVATGKGDFFYFLAGLAITTWALQSFGALLSFVTFSGIALRKQRFAQRLVAASLGFALVYIGASSIF